MIPGIITCTALLALGKTVIVGTHTLNPERLAGIPTVIAVSPEESLAFAPDVFTTCALCCILTSTEGGLRRTTSPMRQLFFCILNCGKRGRQATHLSSCFRQVESEKESYGRPTCTSAVSNATSVQTAGITFRFEA
ncbi:hypothetical protein EV363DRAFT_1405606 [Boletus edulis]|nr:hypothetical protein EV363DRAFT_1405606 [Boletus edulis]